MIERFGEEEQKNVSEAIRSGKLSEFFKNPRGGEWVQRFEEMFAKYHGMPYAISCSNGTSALHIALEAVCARVKVRPSPVVVTPYSFIASVTSVLMAGLKPFFVDVDEKTGTIPNLYDRGQAIPRSAKIIIPVNLIGYPADYKRIYQNSTWGHVIEDNAQGLGAFYHGKIAGSLGDISTCSLQYTKTISSVDYEEPLILMNPKGEIRIVKIGEFVEKCDWHEWKSLLFNKNFEVKFVPITSIYKHPVNEPLYRITLENGRRVIVSQSHSLFTVEDGEAIPKRTVDMHIGDFCLVPLHIPSISTNNIITNLNLAEMFKNHQFGKKLWIHVTAVTKNGRGKHSKRLIEATEEELNNAVSMHNYSAQLPTKIPLTKELARFLGYYIAEGNWSSGAGTLTFGGHERHLAEDAVECLKKIFNIKSRIYDGHSKQTVAFGQHYLRVLIVEMLGCGYIASHKDIPDFIFNSPDWFKLEFLRAYMTGDGHIERRSKKTNYSALITSISKNIADKVPYLLLSLELLPSIEYRKGGLHVILGHSSVTNDSFKIGIRGINQLRKMGYNIDDSNKIGKPQLVECIPVNQTGIKEIAQQMFVGNHRTIRTVFEKQRVSRTVLSKINHPLIHKFIHSQIGFAKIKKIEMVEPSSQYVYDLCINGYENFVGGIGGVFLHNTAGEGGMILTKDPELNRLCMEIRNHGSQYCDSPFLTYNYRLTEIQAAFGVAQMEKLRKFIDIQVGNAEYIINHLPRGIKPPYKENGVDPSYFLVGCSFDEDEAGMSRENFIKKCVDVGISKGVPGASVGAGYTTPIYNKPLFNEYKPLNPLPNVEKIISKAIWFDIHRWDTLDSVKEKIEKMDAILEERSLNS